MNERAATGLAVAVCGIFFQTHGVLGGKPPLHAVVVTGSSNVASGSALCLGVDRPELGSMTTTGSVRMTAASANQWVGRIAVQGSTVSTTATYRLTARTTSSGTHCTVGNGSLAGTAFATNLPLWNPGYVGKTVFYHSTWSNVVVWYRIGTTDAWTNSAEMARIGQGRTAGEHRYRVGGIGEAGRPLEFVMRGVSNGVVQWDNPTVGGVNNNYYTSLDALFIQDKNVFNYVPPATVSAPQVISVGSWGSSYVANGIPSRGGRIYLPRGYAQNAAKRYPVLYMHDGQNVFDPGGDFGSWSADAAATREITQGRMRETILVAVNNTANRMSEYGTPQDGYAGNYYLLYLVNNVKPNVDSAYRTLTGLMDTGNMGSSLGGLISAYAGLSTNVFGLIGAVSPSYWYGPNFRSWINAQPTKGRRIYQDCGTAEGSSMWDYFWPVYGYYLQDDYVVNDDLQVAIGCGEEHNEAAWANRVPGAFRFLYNPWDEINALETNVPPAPGTVQFTAAAAAVPEAAGSVRLWISRVAGSDGAASVGFATSNGTAVAGADFTTTAGVLTWTNQGAATRFVDVPILNDALYEGDETFFVHLSGATGATLGTPATIAATIQDDEAPPPQLVITHPPADLDVDAAVASYDLQGTLVSGNWQGLSWTNGLTGGSGPIPLADLWQVPGLPLGPGANVIAVLATNAAPRLILHAADAATNAAYAGGWTNGGTGGIGFGPWNLQADAVAGHFISGNGWGLWSQSNNLAEAVRPFAAPLAPEQRFRSRFRNGWVFEGRQGVGLALRDAGGTPLIQFYFNGGDAEYQVEDAAGGRNSGIGWTDQPQDVEIELLTATSYVMRVGSAVIPGTCTGALAQVRFWNWSGGAGTNYNLSFDHLQIDSLGAGLASTAATVTITRAAPELHDGIPTWWWDKYGLGTNRLAADDDDEDGVPNGEEYVADTDPTDPDSTYPNRIVVATGEGIATLQAGPPTTNSRVYDVWFATHLLPAVWEPFHLDRPGDALGGPVFLSVTNAGEIRYYRTGVKLPPGR